MLQNGGTTDTQDASARREVEKTALEIWNPSITPFTKTRNAEPTDPGSPSENGNGT